MKNKVRRKGRRQAGCHVGQLMMYVNSAGETLAMVAIVPGGVMRIFTPLGGLSLREIAASVARLFSDAKVEEVEQSVLDAGPLTVADVPRFVAAIEAECRAGGMRLVKVSTNLA